jgi:hypothetical protein
LKQEALADGRQERLHGQSKARFAKQKYRFWTFKTPEFFDLAESEPVTLVAKNKAL